MLKFLPQKTAKSIKEREKKACPTFNFDFPVLGRFGRLNDGRSGAPESLEGAGGSNERRGVRCVGQVGLPDDGADRVSPQAGGGMEVGGEPGGGRRHFVVVQLVSSVHDGHGRRAEGRRRRTLRTQQLQRVRRAAEAAQDLVEWAAGVRRLILQQHRRRQTHHARRGNVCVRHCLALLLSPRTHTNAPRGCKHKQRFYQNFYSSTPTLFIIGSEAQG
jgi:hypothetical protein